MTDAAGGIWAALITGIFGLISLLIVQSSRGKRRQADTDDLIAKLDARNAATIVWLQGQLDQANERIRQLTNQLTNRGGGHD